VPVQQIDIELKARGFCRNKAGSIYGMKLAEFCKSNGSPLLRLHDDQSCRLPSKLVSNSTRILPQRL
jgi:hypothetical protein